MRVLANASACGFSYANLETVDLLALDDPGQGPNIVLCFAGITASEVRLSGRNLDLLYQLLCDQGTRRIRERATSRDFLAEKEMVITKITSGKLEP